MDHLHIIQWIVFHISVLLVIKIWLKSLYCYTSCWKDVGRDGRTNGDVQRVHCDERCVLRYTFICVNVSAGSWECFCFKLKLEAKTARSQGKEGETLRRSLTSRGLKWKNYFYKKKVCSLLSFNVRKPFIWQCIIIFLIVLRVIMVLDVNYIFMCVCHADSWG